MNHFKVLNKVKELEIFFFAQHAKVQTDQNRAEAECLDQATSALSGTQQTSKYLTSLLMLASPTVGHFSDRKEFCAVLFAHYPVA